MLHDIIFLMLKILSRLSVFLSKICVSYNIGDHNFKMFLEISKTLLLVTVLPTYSRFCLKERRKGNNFLKHFYQ